MRACPIGIGRHTPNTAAGLGRRSHSKSPLPLPSPHLRVKRRQTRHSSMPRSLATRLQLWPKHAATRQPLALALFELESLHCGAFGRNRCSQTSRACAKNAHRRRALLYMSITNGHKSSSRRRHWATVTARPPEMWGRPCPIISSPSVTERSARCAVPCSAPDGSPSAISRNTTTWCSRRSR